MTETTTGRSADEVAAQAAYEAWHAQLAEHHPDVPGIRGPYPWDQLADEPRREWRAAARAAIAAQAWSLADQAIGLFLENRDMHGHDESSARIAAAQEIAEGAAVTEAEISGSLDGGRTGRAAMTAPEPARAAKEAFISGCVKRGITAAQVTIGSAADADGVWKETAQAAIEAYKADRAAQVAEWEHVSSTAAGGQS